MLFRPRSRMLVVSFIAILSIFTVACGTTLTVVISPTFTSTAVAKATLVPAPATSVPTPPPPQVCNSADFVNSLVGGPDEGFSYPAQTYYVDKGSGAGNHYYILCSPANLTASSILAAMKTSIPGGGWSITASTATTLSAIFSVATTNGYCATIDITVGGHTGYTSEWDADIHPPLVYCA